MLLLNESCLQSKSFSLVLQQYWVREYVTHLVSWIYFRNENDVWLTLSIVVFVHTVCI